MNSLNVWYPENPIENCVYWMYKWSKYVEKFEFVKCTISWKFNGNLCTLDVQNARIRRKIEFIECTNLNLLNIQNHENSKENCVQQMYRKSIFVEKFKFIECTISRKFNGKLGTLDVQTVRILGNIQIC